MARDSTHYKRYQAKISAMDIDPIPAGITVVSGFVGQSIQPKASSQSCLVSPQFPTVPAAETDDRDLCLYNPDVCMYGLSLGVWVRFAAGELTADTPKVLVGTDNKGYRIWHEGRQLKAALWTRTRYWDAAYSLGDYQRDYERALDNRWINVAFRWNKWDGMELLVDGYRKSPEGQFIGGTPEVRGPTDVPKHLYIGCEPDGAGKKSVSDSELDEVVLFSRRVRDDELVILTGGYLYRAEELIPKTTTVDPNSQTQAPPLYDYAAKTDLLQKANKELGENECYKIAEKHWTLDQKNLVALTTGGAVMQTTGINGAQSAVKFSDALSYVKLGTFANHCLGSWNNCLVRGFAVSVWLYFRQSISVVADTEYILLQSNFSLTSGWQFVYKNDQILIKTARAEVKVFAIAKELTPRRTWLNVGVSWYMVPGTSNEHTEIYVNGMPARVTSGTPTGADPAQGNGDTTLGSSGHSLVGMTACNVAYFNRYLFPVERHKLLGLTAEELNNFVMFTGYWTANEFVDRDELSNRIYKLKDRPTPSFIKGHDDRRGSAVEIEKSKDGWMLLGATRRSDDPITQEVGKMTGPLVGFTDPSMCKEGIVITMRLQVQSYESSAPSYILSTGEQDYESRGVSMYLYNQRFYLGVVDNERIWKVTLSKDKVPEGVWVYLVASWSRDHGLWIAINGVVQSVNSLGAEDERQTDRLTRATLGRDNREAVFLGMSMYAFESLTYKDGYMDTSRFRKYLGLIDNAIYAEADHYWDVARMIDSNLKSLLHAKTVNAKNWPGPGNSATSPKSHKIQVHPKWVIVDGGAHDFVNLGVYEPDSCVCNPAKCPNGLTVSVWAKVNQVASLTSPVDLIRCKPDSGAAGRSTGFQLRVTQDMKIRAIVRTATEEWTAEAANASEVDKWFNAGFSWSDGEGLKIYHNGRDLAIDKNHEGTAKDGSPLAPAAVNVRSDLLIAHGDGNPVYLEYHEAAVWESYTYKSSSAIMMGFTSQQQILFLNDYYWPFDGIVEDLGMSTIQPELHGGATWVPDAAMTGRAVRTDERRQGYVSLGTHVKDTGCIVNPELCRTLLVVALNVKLKKNQEGTLFSSGAQTPGSRGVHIHQYTNNSLEFVVADGKKVYRQITDDIAYEKWTQVVVTWKEGQLDLSIGGESPIISAKFVYDEVRPTVTTTVTLGRHNDAADGFIDAEFDEISFKYYMKQSEPTPEADKIKRGGCFGTTSQIFYLDSADDGITKDESTVAAIDRYGNNMALQTGATGHISLGDYREKCLSDPGRCGSAAVTISLWLKLLDTSPTSGTILCSGPGTTRGFLMELKSGKVDFTVQTAVKKWEVKGVTIGAVGQWVNLALSWSPTDGLLVFVNGTQKDSAPTSIAASFGSDTHTTFLLGNTNGDMGPAHLAAVYDDLAIWTEPIPLENRDKILRGECYDAVEQADPNAFTRAPPTTPAPTTPWVPPTETSCDSWTADRVCVGGTPSEADLKIMGDSDFRYSTSSAAQLNEISKKSSATAKTAGELESLIKINEKIAQARPPNTVEVADFKIEAQKLLDSSSNIIDAANRPELKKLTAKNMTEKVVTSLEEFIKKWTEALPGSLGDNCTNINLDSTNIIVQTSKWRLGNCQNNSVKFPDYEDPRMVARVTDWRGKDEKNLIGLDQVEISGKAAFDHATGYKTVQIYGAFYRSIYDVIPNTRSDSDQVLVGVARPIRVNSNVMSLSLIPPRPPNRPLIHNALTFHMGHKDKNAYLVLRTEHQVATYCGFLEEEPLSRGISIWSTRGCNATNTTKHRTTCSCNHMTNFAILMEEIIPKPRPIFDIILSIVMYICLGISIACMVSLVFTIALHSDLMTERNLIHLNLAIAMTFGNIAYLFNEIAMPHVYFCRVIGIFIHFFWTAGYIWLFVESLYVFYAITSGILRGRLKCYMPLCWGIPVVLVSAVAGTNISAYGWERYCWLSPVGHYIYAFIGPIMAFILITAIMLMIIICNLPQPAIKKEEILRELRRLTRDTMFLIVALCMTWIFASVIVWNESQALLFVFTIMFNLQGFFMFLVIVSGSNDIQRYMPCLPCLRKRGIGNRKASRESMVRDGENGEKTEVFYMGPMASTSNVRNLDSPDALRTKGSHAGSPSVTPPISAGNTLRGKSPPPVSI